ncbi:MAG: M28 family peptidase [Acidimicrobiales bacterium]
MGNADHLALDRRAFMAGVVAAAVAAACSSGDDDDAESGSGTTTTTAAASALPGDLRPEDVPTRDQIFSWIEEVFDQGVRRPGYEADIWAEEFISEYFREIGLENVRMEPVEVTRWEPLEWSLEVTPQGGETRTLDSFPLPYSAPVEDLEIELVPFDEANAGAVAGKASFVVEELLRLPPKVFAGFGSAPPDAPDRVVDPEGTFDAEGAEHVLPFGSQLQEVMEPSIEAGAVAFIGALVNYPGDSCQYMVPYDGIDRPIPGVWIRGSDGEWLRDQLAAGPVSIRLRIDSSSEPFQSNNVVGELPGADDEVVMVGSHHDGPWASAVEDGSGISLVLAQATFWAAQPTEQRPHRMVFILQAGHMSGGAGLLTYIEEHRAELDAVVLQLHLEHAALEFEEVDGEVVSADRPVPRWWFVSRIPPLEEAVIEALNEEELSRSMLLAPDAIGTQPATDGAFYHNEGVPIVHFLAAPFYLFDEMDRPDKIDQENLVPLTRAAIRIIESTRGVSAADLRAALAV